MNDQPIKKQTFLQGTAILAMATVLVKLMGFLFKVPLNNIIGEDGFGSSTPPMTSITSCS